MASIRDLLRKLKREASDFQFNSPRTKQALNKTVKDFNSKLDPIVGSGSTIDRAALSFLKPSIELGQRIGETSVKNVGTPNKEFLKDVGKNVVPQAARVGIQVALSNKALTTLSGLKTLGVVGGLNTGINSFKTGSFKKGAQEAVADIGPTLTRSGLYSLSNPVFAKAARSIGATKFIPRNAVAGVGNLIEDEITSRLLKIDPKLTNQDRIVSFLAPGAFEGVGLGLKSGSNLFSKIFSGASDQIAQQVDGGKVVAKIGDVVGLVDKRGRKLAYNTKTKRYVPIPQVKRVVSQEIPFSYMGREQPPIKSRGEVTEPAFGAIAGIEPETDEEGRITGFGFDPVKGVAGVGVAAGIRNIDIDNYKKQIGTVVEDRRSFREAFDSFYTNWVNRFSPIEKLTSVAEESINSKIIPEKSPEFAIKRLLGAGGKAELRHKQVLQPILDGLGDIPKDDFDVFLKAKRDVELGGRGVFGSDPAEAQKVLKALASKYDLNTMNGVAEQLYAYQRKNLDMLGEAGFLSEESIKTIKQANTKYVPFERVMEDVDNYLGVPTAKAQQATQVVKKIKGSEKQILSPIESIIANTYKIEAAVSKNRVARSIGDLATLNKDLGVVPLRTAENVKRRIEIFTTLKKTRKYKNSLQRALKTRNRWGRKLQRELDRLNKLGIDEYLKRPDPKEPPKALASLKIKGRVKPAGRGNSEFDEIIQGEVDRLMSTVGGTYTIPQQGTDRLRRVSANPNWYRNIFAQNGGRPNKTELAELAERNLRTGSVDGYYDADEAREVSEYLDLLVDSQPQFSVTSVADTTKQLSPTQTRKLINSLIQDKPKVQAIKNRIANKDQKMYELLNEIEDLSNDLQEQLLLRGELFDEAKTLKDLDKKGIPYISVWRDGVKEYYQVPKDVADSVKGLNEESMGALLRLLAAPARLLRQQATGRNIDFMIPNVFRDQFDAAVNSEYGYQPFLDYFRGLAHLMNYKRTGSDEIVEEWINSGGKIFFENMAGRKAIKEQIDKATKPTKAHKRLIEWAVGGIETLGEISETPTRVGLFKRALSETGNPLIAAKESRESTLDFARMGAKMRVANSLIPFLNAQIQGFDRMVRSAKDNPSMFGLRLATYAMLPQATLSLYNNLFHPEEYAGIPDFEKEGNFIVITGGKDSEGNAEYIKIPKGHVVQLASAPVDNLVTWSAGNDPQSFQQLALSMFSGALPVLAEGDSVGEIATRTAGGNLPQAIKPLVEHTSNFNFYKGRDIVPWYLQDKPPEEQFFKTTPAPYKALGGLINASPLKIQNFAEGTLAGGVKQPINLASTLYNVSNNQPANPNKIPIARRFFGSYSGFDNERPEGVNTEPTALFQGISNTLGVAQADEPIQEATQESELSGILNTVSAEEARALELPKEQAQFDRVYRGALADLESNRQKLADLPYQDLEEKDRLEKEELYNNRIAFAETLYNRMREESPEMVFEAELATYGGNKFKVPERAAWALEQIAGVRDEEGLQKLVNNLWDAGVLTKGGNGTADYLLESFGLDLFTYTGDNDVLKKNVNKKEKPKKTGRKRKAPKLSIRKSSLNAPRIRFKSAPAPKVKISTGGVRRPNLTSRPSLALGRINPGRIADVSYQPKKITFKQPTARFGN